MFPISKKTGLDGALATFADDIGSTKDECTTIKGRNAWSLDLSQDVVTGPDFESEGFTSKYQGLRDASGSLGGFMDPEDTDGLKEIFEAFFDGDEKGLKLWLDDDHYVYCEVLFTGPAFDIPLEDMQSADIDFEVSNLKKDWLLAAFDSED
ncbi:MAG: hypothetical protein ACOC1X_04510 [Promethearchaeota archaeon]